ncbi:hypothetical protein [Moheibacter sp.]|uniref:hypothetical protein n=1 Tax=Moheibacter sp. TaxID=1965316 RepID=UPI003C781942
MFKLQKIKRKDLDVDKYSKALNDASNYRIYAEHWYLDILTEEKWECLVFGDYEVIMPIPLQYKFGIKFVLQPIYCQQLGVFYKEEISDELFREFEKKLHRYKVRAYHFNEENTERYQPEGERRTNFILDLSSEYKAIRTGYKDKRKKDINRSKNHNLEVEKSWNLNFFYKLQKDFYSLLNPISEMEMKSSLLLKLLEKDSLRLFYIKKEGKYIAAQAFVYSKNRIYCLAFYRHKELDKYNSSAFIKNHLIETEATQNLLLDFEGSMIPGVASFIEGFGAEKRYFKNFSNFEFPAFLKKTLSKLR